LLALVKPRQMAATGNWEKSLGQML
jgi:hypothetical protein